MNTEPLNLGEEDGYRALRGHVAEKARLGRERYGPDFDPEAVRALLADPDVVRFSTQIEFSSAELRPGEFAYLKVSQQGPKGGFTLFVHDEFEGSPELLSLLVAYHIPSINYLDIAGPEEAELFGSTLHGLSKDEYYERLCALVDGLPGPKAPEITAEVAALMEPPSQPDATLPGVLDATPAAPGESAPSHATDLRLGPDTGSPGAGSGGGGR